MTTPAPPIAGTASRNENRAASVRVNPRASPPEIVLPDRENPRKTSDASWHSPIVAQSPSFIDDSSRSFRLIRCPYHSAADVISQPQATNSGCSNVASSFFLNSTPITAVGIVARMIHPQSRKSRSTSRRSCR